MKIAKSLVAVAGAVIAAAQIALQDGDFSQQDWVTVVIALVTAVGVYLIPNKEA